jgi:hypothetical protein
MPKMRSESVPDSDNSVPDLRREFVGIMFALAVAEVGLQVAALVQAGQYIHYLPGYSHLLLALLVIAASWVGWSRTQVPSAKKDVRDLFEWPFLVLLLDTAMVITYFILVRTVDFSDGNRRIDAASTVAFWHVVIFVLYLSWDLVTKVAMYPKPAGVGWLSGWWHLSDQTRRKQMRTILRGVPTVLCLALTIILWRLFHAVDVVYEHLLTADLALGSVVLLFRALKGAMSGPNHNPAAVTRHRRWAVALLVLLVVGTSMTIWSIRVPLPGSWLQEMRTPVSEMQPTSARAEYASA